MKIKTYFSSSFSVEGTTKPPIKDINKADSFSLDIDDVSFSFDKSIIDPFNNKLTLISIDKLENKESIIALIENDTAKSVIELFNKEYLNNPIHNINAENNIFKNEYINNKIKSNSKFSYNINNDISIYFNEASHLYLEKDLNSINKSSIGLCSNYDTSITIKGGLNSTVFN